jgi:long-subunit acyl-CoA synthetase (AMP-forming)
VALIGHRRIKIIDRVKNIFKLSQGVFVSPQMIESVLLASRYVRQIFVTHGSLQFQQDCLVGVIVPDQENCSKLVVESNLSFEKLCADEKVKTEILKDIQMIGALHKLAPYEVPVEIVLEPESWTVDNQKLTHSDK